jgi:rSAM/selenodomain-associated transferase 2/rSAM/selenodomain-associated transferase 1
MSHVPVYQNIVLISGSPVPNAATLLEYRLRTDKGDNDSTMPSDNHIMIFARYPVPGKAKTRLIPALGPEGAARMHRRMTEHVVSVARAVRKLGNAAVWVHFTQGRERDFRAWLGADLDYALQCAGDLGTRLLWAFKTAFQDGAKAALAVGSDVPGMTAEILRQGLEDLHDHDVVIGPAVDGGYYLIGMQSLHSELFTGIDWGTGRVCGQTLARIDSLGLKVAELPRLSDVDRSEDLPPLHGDIRFSDIFSGKPLISVIIPTLNEALMLGRTLECLSKADAVEVIVTDGGSRDDTREIAARSGARVLKVSGGRAAQQNAGSAVANGRLLLFLHADTLLPRGYADLIRRALDCPATVAGAFRFQTDSPRAAMRLIEWGANFRSAVFQWPYGDQGLFLDKRVFDEEGGFPALPIMEDFEFVRRLRRRGPITTLPDAAVTSARRWQQLGLIRTTLINQMMIAGFLNGVSVQRLKDLYGTNRSPGNKRTPYSKESSRYDPKLL